jgi:hypothetical protein
MKTILILLLAWLPSHAEIVSLTDAKGRSVWATILSGDGDSVRISKTDGKEFTLRLADLTEDSRKTVAAKIAGIEAAKPKGIIVSHVITKLVDGKFRYFFDIRNHEAKPWTGSATITLLNTQPGVKNGEAKFVSTKPTEPGLGTSVFFDARTGPASVHGEWSVAGFSYVIKDAAGKDESSGQGVLSLKTEGF